MARLRNFAAGSWVLANVSLASVGCGDARDAGSGASGGASAETAGAASGGLAGASGSAVAGSAAVGGAAVAVGGGAGASGTGGEAVEGSAGSGAPAVPSAGGNGGAAASGEGGANPSGAGGGSNTGGQGAAVTTLSTEARQIAASFADTVIQRWPDPRNITGTARGWDYNNGIVLRGMQAVYETTRDARYRTYIKKYVDYFVDGSGVLFVDAAHTLSLASQPHSLDLIQPAGLLLFLAREFPSEAKYMKAADGVRALFPRFPVNGAGGFWHKQTYPNEMWLDGIFMAQPFLAQYGAMTPSCGAYCTDTPLDQISLLAGHVKLASGLFLHGWDEDHDAVWCTGKCAGASGSGLSPEVWSRGLGWFAMALVDVLEWLPATHPRRGELITLLQGIAGGLEQARDEKTGLWCQVVDKCKTSGNWVEASGSAFFIYALQIGAARGYLAPKYRTLAESAWSELRTREIGKDASGPTFNDSAEGMSIQANYDAYVARLKVSNFYHGLCAVQLAAAATAQR